MIRRLLGLGTAFAVFLCLLAGCTADKPLAPSAGMKTVTLKAEGMHWATGWPPKAEAALVRVEGFKKMKADVSKEEVEVEYDPAKTNPEALAQAITKYSEFKGSVKNWETARLKRAGLFDSSTEPFPKKTRRNTLTASLAPADNRGIALVYPRRINA